MPPTLQSQTILSPERLGRKVLLALELFDPLSQAPVWDGLKVTATGLGKPIVNLSGRFVWLDEGAAWPTQITITPLRAPFEPQTIFPALPADPAHPTLKERLVRAILTPAASADFSNDVTAVRGQIFESLTPPSPPVIDAQARLAWFDKDSSGVWVPSPEQPATTIKAGQFGVFLRLRPVNHQLPDLTGKFLKARLEFIRGTTRRATALNFPFLDGPDPPGCVIEGRLLPRDVKLGWAELNAI